MKKEDLQKVLLLTQLTFDLPSRRFVVDSLIEATEQGAASMTGPGLPPQRRSA
jgi:hypothetical protein